MEADYQRDYCLEMRIATKPGNGKTAEANAKILAGMLNNYFTARQGSTRYYHASPEGLFVRITMNAYALMERDVSNAFLNTPGATACRQNGEAGVRLKLVDDAAARIKTAEAKISSAEERYNAALKELDDLRKKYDFTIGQLAAAQETIKKYVGVEKTLTDKIKAVSAKQGDKQKNACEADKTAQLPKPKKGKKGKSLAMPGEEFVDYINRRFEEIGWGWYDFAEKSGLGIQQVDRIFRGETKRPRMSTLEIIAPHLKTSAEYLASLIPEDVQRPGRKAI